MIGKVREITNIFIATRKLMKPGRAMQGQGKGHMGQNFGSILSKEMYMQKVKSLILMVRK